MYFDLNFNKEPNKLSKFRIFFTNEHKFTYSISEKCHQPQVKFCKTGDVCLSYSVQATTNITMLGTRQPALMTLKGHGCGPKNHTISEQECKIWATEIDKNFAAEEEFKAENVNVTCGAVDKCSKDCVSNDHMIQVETLNSEYTE